MEGRHELDERKLEDELYDSNLIINYLPPSVDDEALRNLFRPYGNILSCKIVKDKFTQQSLCYGFVKYDNKDSALKATAALNGHQCENKRLKVAIARPSSKEIMKSNLYIAGLPEHFTKVELAQLVAPYGRVIECRVLYDTNTKRSRGVGFARLDTHQSAVAAIKGLHGQTPANFTNKLQVKFADTPKESALRKQSQLFAQVVPRPGFPLQGSSILQAPVFSQSFVQYPQHGGSPSTDTSRMISAISASTPWSGQMHATQYRMSSLLAPVSPSLIDQHTTHIPVTSLEHSQAHQHQHQQQQRLEGSRNSHSSRR